MISLLISFLAQIPGLASLASSWTQARYNAQVAITQAKIGGDRDVAVALVNAAVAREHENASRLSIIAGSKILVFMLVGFALPFIIYEWKIVVVDIVFQAGSTDPIKGQVAEWATSIIGFLFGSSTALTLGSMWFNRSGR